MPSRDVKGKRCLDVWIFDELLWRVIPVDAVVVAGEDPCVLLIARATSAASFSYCQAVPFLLGRGDISAS